MMRISRVGVFALLALLLTACGGGEERAARYLERAQAAFDEGDYIKAELDAKNALQIQPNNFDASYLMAEIAEKQNQPTALFRNLSRAVAIDPTKIEAQVKLGRIWAAAGRPDEAMAAVEAIREADPDNPEGRVLEALVMMRGGDRDGALDIVEGVLESHPRNISALTFVASWYQQIDIDKSLAYLDQAIGFEPENRSLREIKIALLQNVGRLEQAEAALRDLIARFPDQNNYRYSLAQYLTSRERIDEAEKVLRDLVAADTEDLTAKLTLAQFLGQRRDPDAALELLRGYVAQEPDVYQFRFALGQIYAATKRYPEARKIFREIIERDGMNAHGLNARTKLAALEFTAGDRADGERLIAEVLEKEPSNTDALVMRASVALASGDADTAVADLRTVLRADPSRENAQLLLGKAHIQAGDRNLAIEALQKLVDSHPNNTNGRKDLARLLIQAGRWDEVRGILAVGVQQQPQDLTMARMYIDALMRLEDWDAAAQQADRVLALEPDKALGYYVQARVSQARGDYDESIESFKRALDLEPSAVETITGIVRSYVRKDDIAGARAFLQEFIADHPDNVHGYTLLGEMQAREGNFEAAEASNEKALSMEEGWLPAYRNLIGIHLRNNDLDAANDVVSRGLKVSPGNTELNLLRANIYERGGRFGEAISLYRAELEKNPAMDIAANNYIALVADHQNDPASLEAALRFGQRFADTQNPIFQDTLGWLYYRMGEYDEALPLLEAAVARAGQLAQLRYHLGMTYYKLDRLELARTELEAAVADASGTYTGRDEAKATLALL